MSFFSPHFPSPFFSRWSHSIGLKNLRWSSELLVELRLIVSSYFHSASQSCPILSANWKFRHILHLLLFHGDRSGMNKTSSATWLLYSDVVKGEVPRGQGKIRKRTKKMPWKGQPRSRRFSFHNFYTFFFFQLPFFIIFFFYTLFTHDIYQHPRPLHTTHDI